MGQLEVHLPHLKQLLVLDITMKTHHKLSQTAYTDCVILFRKRRLIFLFNKSASNGITGILNTFLIFVNILDVCLLKQCLIIQRLLTTTKT